MKQGIIYAIFLFFLTSSIYGGAFKSLINSFYSTNSFTELLGRGGTGKVIGSEENHKAIKGSKTTRGCIILEKEFALQKKINNAINDLNLTSFTINVITPQAKKIVKIKDANKEEPQCFLEMDRLYPIVEETNQKVLTQPYLGRNTCDMLQADEESDIIKGHNIGYKEVEEITQRYDRTDEVLNNIEHLCYNIGRYLAIIHFKIKIDGKDTEICLARTNPDIYECKVSMIDFGMAQNIFTEDQTEKDVIEEIIKAMTLEPFFPNPTSSSFKHFRNGYLEIAQLAGKENLAKKIIDVFITTQFLQEIATDYLTKEIGISPKRIFQLNKLKAALAQWLQPSLLERIKANEYHSSREEIYKLSKNIIPNIIKEKENETLQGHEKSLLTLLKKKLDQREGL